MIICSGAIDERTVEPAAETDDRQTVFSELNAVGRIVVLVVPPPSGRRDQTDGSGCGQFAAAVEPEVLAAGFQLRGLPEAVGHGQRVAGERDRAVAGPADSGHGQGAQPVLRQASVHPVHAGPVGRALGHAVHVRAEQRHAGRRVQRSRAERRGHLRHVLVPVAAARARRVHGVRRVLQESRVRVLGQQRRPQLLRVRGRPVQRRPAAAATAAAPVRAVARPGLRLRPPPEAARPLFRRPVQAELVVRVARPENRRVRVLVNVPSAACQP